MSGLLPSILLETAERVLIRCQAGGHMLALAESCTGGLVSAALTSISGSSAVVERGFVTYTNRSKIEMLGVPVALIEQHGAVSKEVAQAMAAGALTHTPADISIAITGIAGPGGGTPGKPVGTVHLASATKDGAILHRHLVLSGDRNAVRLAASVAALELVLTSLDDGYSAQTGVKG